MEYSDTPRCNRKIFLTCFGSRPSIIEKTNPIIQKWEGLLKRRLILVFALSIFLSCQNSTPAPGTHTRSPNQNENRQINPDNYCNDKEGWEEWDRLIRKYPNDSDLQALHALRIGLCVKIGQGSIRLEDAIDIFDQAHQAVIEKAKQKAKGKEPSI